MPRSSLIFLLIGFLSLPAKAQRVHLDSTSTPDRPVYTVVQQQPEFPGGMRQLENYMRKNLRRPTGLTADPGGSGRVFITFIINEDGHIDQARVLKGIGPKQDEEALRLIQNMPNWIPGKMEGRPVACRYNLPVNFNAR